MLTQEDLLLLFKRAATTPGVSTYIKSSQQFNITLASGEATHDYTLPIALTDLTRAFISEMSWTNSSATNQSAIIAPNIAILNSTTIRVIRNNTDTGTITVDGCVVDPDPSLVDSVISGAIAQTGATSGNLTVSAFDVTRYCIIWLGNTSTDSSANAARRTNVFSTSSTNIRTTSNSSSTGSTRFVLIQWNANVCQSSSQSFQPSFSDSSLTNTQAILSTVIANTILCFGGVNHGGSGIYTMALTPDADPTRSILVTFTRLATATAARIPAITLQEFKPNVIKSLQANVIQLANQTSVDQAVTAVDTTKAFPLFQGERPTSTDTPNAYYMRVNLTAANTMTGKVNSNTASTKAVGYMLPEFF